MNGMYSDVQQQEFDIGCLRYKCSKVKKEHNQVKLSE
jgi:hypothetical protein